MKSILKSLGLLLLSLLAITTNAQELEFESPEKIAEHSVARLTITTDFKFIDVVIARDVFNTLPVTEEKTAELNLALKSLSDGAQDASIKIANALKTRAYVFTGSPGKYAIKITGFDSRYGIKKVSAIITIGGQIDDGGDDDTGNDDDDDAAPSNPTPPADKFALTLWEKALKVKSSNRASEAKGYAKVFRSIAGKAAGLGNWTAQDVLNETGKGLNGFDDSIKRKWDSWNDELQTFLKSKGLSEKQELINAWASIAIALEAVE